MTVPKQLNIDGAMSIGPIQPTTFPFPSGEGTVSLNTTQTTQADNGPRGLSVNSPSSFQDLLSNSGVTNIRALYLRVRTGQLTVQVSSSAAAMQQFVVSDMLVLSCPIPGTELTALGVKGTADIELMMAGT